MNQSQIHKEDHEKIELKEYFWYFYINKGEILNETEGDVCGDKMI